jgi:hypothetical protein
MKIKASVVAELLKCLLEHREAPLLGLIQALFGLLLEGIIYFTGHLEKLSGTSDINFSGPSEILLRTRSLDTQRNQHTMGIGAFLWTLRDPIAHTFSGHSEKYIIHSLFAKCPSAVPSR